MEWIVEGRDGQGTARFRKRRNTKGAPGSRERPSETKQEARLLLGGLGGLVAGVDLLARLVQNALHLSGIGTGRGQLKVLLVSFSATGRQNDLLRLDVEGGFLD